MSRLIDVAAVLESMAKALKGTEQGVACEFAVRLMRDKHPDTEIVDYLARMWDSQGKGHHIMGRWFPNTTGSFRDAVSARKEVKP